jgi:hypothetical protein
LSNLDQFFPSIVTGKRDRFPAKFSGGSAGAVMNRNDTEVAAAAFTTVISKDVRFVG